jgi:hypothetical protein
VLGEVTGLNAGRAEQRGARLIGAAALLTGAGLHLVFVPSYSLPVLDGLFTALGGHGAWCGARPGAGPA